MNGIKIGKKRELKKSSRRFKESLIKESLIKINTELSYSAVSDGWIEQW